MALPLPLWWTDFFKYTLEESKNKTHFQTAEQFSYLATHANHLINSRRGDIRGCAPLVVRLPGSVPKPGNTEWNFNMAGITGSSLSSLTVSCRGSISQEASALMLSWSGAMYGVSVCEFLKLNTLQR